MAKATTATAVAMACFMAVHWMRFPAACQPRRPPCGRPAPERDRIAHATAVSRRRSRMKRTFRTAIVWSLVSLGAAATAWAHHSFAAAFDMDKPVTVQGTIVQVRLENPHSWFFLDVKSADGKLERWAFEAGTPSGMI